MPLPKAEGGKADVQLSAMSGKNDNRPSLAGERRGLSRGEGAPPGTLKAILPGDQAAHHSPLLQAATRTVFRPGGALWQV